jgi:hypothetical protein
VTSGAAEKPGLRHDDWRFLRCAETRPVAAWRMMGAMSQPDLDPEEYPPIDPREPAPDDAGELLPDTPDELPEAPVEPLPDDGDEGGVREPA